MALERQLKDYMKQVASRPILEIVAKESGWIKDDTGRREKNEIISDIHRRLRVADVSGAGNLIRVYATGTDPQETAELANKIAEVFKRVNSEQKNQHVRNVRLFIEEQLVEIEDRLKGAQERMRFLIMQGAVGAGANIIKQINTLEMKRSDLLTRFTESHPEVIRMNDQIARLKEELKELPEEEFEYGILERDTAINERLYGELKSKLNEVKIREAEKIDNITIISPALPPRRPFFPNKKRSYSVGAILGALLAITTGLVIEHLDTSIGRVEDVESFVKTSVLGVIPYCIGKRKIAEKTEKKWQRVFFRKKIKKIPLFEEVPIFELEQQYSSIFLEAFRILSVNLQVLFGGGGRIKNKVIMITSCNPEEGKTVVVSNLSIILAQMGYKVLIMDTDTRRASVHKIFGLKKKEGGFMDILTGKMTPDSVVRTATDLMLGTAGADKIMDKPWLNNLNIVTAGSVFPNPITLFNSDKMNETLNYFKNKYDIVLLDSSPILAVSEPSIIIPKTDGVLLVYKAGATSRLALRRAKIQIEGVKGKGGLAGVILNNVTPEIGMDTYYYYSRKYYGEEERKKARDVKKSDETIT